MVYILSSSVLHSHICSGSHTIALYNITGEAEGKVRPDPSEGKDLKKEITPPQSPPTSGTYTSFIHSLSNSVLHTHICICSGSHNIVLYNITGDAESQVRPDPSEGQDLKKEITPPHSPPANGIHTIQFSPTQSYLYM